MDLQSEFDRTIEMLCEYRTGNEIIRELLDHYQSREITFHTTDKKAKESNKNHLLSIYQTRAGLEEVLKEDNPNVINYEELHPRREGFEDIIRRNGSFVIGYDKLLPNLEATAHQEIATIAIRTSLGTYIIFSDFEMKDFIGILKTKRTLQQVRQKNFEYKGRVKESGHEVSFDYEANEHVFVNGKLKSKI